MAARRCIVTETDVRGIRHSVEVTASSLFDAAGHALASLRADGWVEALGPASRLDVAVAQPAVTHTVTVQQLERWANGAATSPEERIRKEDLRALLTASATPRDVG